MSLVGVGESFERPKLENRPRNQKPGLRQRNFRRGEHLCQKTDFLTTVFEGLKEKIEALIDKKVTPVIKIEGDHAEDSEIAGRGDTLGARSLENIGNAKYGSE